MNHLLLTQISKGINRLLAFDPASQQRLQALAGKTIRIDLQPFNLSFVCQFDDAGVTIHQNLELPPDVTLGGTPLQLMGAMLDKHNRQRFFADDLVMEGNAALGQHVVDLFDQLDIDWQEQTSKVIGDSATHHLSQVIGTIKSWLSTANRDLSNDLNHYLHDEKNWFPTRSALQGFFADVDETRMRIDRAEARLKHLTEIMPDENAL